MLFDLALAAALQLLYREAAHYNVSMDLVQCLAQHLRLETFVDTELGNGALRLSIAGSLLLIDIDYTSDSAPTKVALSLGSCRDEARWEAETPVRRDGGVLVLFDNNPYSFLRCEKLEPAEAILLRNLQSDKLGQFPRNLEYLANLDRLSPPEGDLVVYLDNVALYLATVHSVECEGAGWEMQAGYSSSVGKLRFNNEAEGLVGFFLQFWEDARLVGRAGQPGFQHVALLSVAPLSEPPIDYLKAAADAQWAVGGATRFWFEGALHLYKGQSVTEQAKDWRLFLTLNKAVHLPTEVVEHLGLCDVHAGAESLHEQTLEFSLQDVVLSFSLDEPSRYVALESFSIPSLALLARILPTLRNFAVLQNMLANVAAYPAVERPQSSLKEALQMTETTDDLFALNMGEAHAHEETGVHITLREVSYSAPCVTLTVNGKYKEHLLDGTFTIANGVVASTTDNKFVEALGMCEDPVAALQVL